MAGVRSSKTVGSTTYKYDTLSGKVMRQSWGSNVIDFVYDENNQPYAMRYNGTVYYYVLNVQGDVVGLLNSSGELVVEYKYDPWGKLLETKIGVDESNAKYDTYNNMALRNPLRYRGYIYDRDTGLYYLQSRYYDPAIGRFINADTYATTDADGLLSTNMFAYCENNPVMRADENGKSATIAGAIVGFVAGALSARIDGGSFGQAMACGVSGAITGMVAGFVADLTLATGGLAAGVAATAVANGLCNGVNSAVSQKIMKGSVDNKQMFFDAGVGAVTGALGAATSDITKPIVKGLKNGLKYVRNKVTCEIGEMLYKTSSTTIKALKTDAGFAAVTSFGNWLYSKWFGAIRH